MNHIKPGCWIIHVRVIIQISPPIVTVIHRTTAWCIVIIIPSLLNNYAKTSNKQSTKVYQLPGPIISSNGLYDVSIWKVLCRFNKKRISGFITSSFQKSSDYNVVVRYWSRDGMQHTQRLSVSLKLPASTPVHLKLSSAHHEVYVWVEVKLHSFLTSTLEGDEWPGF